MPSNKKRQTSINESLAPRRKSSRKAGKRNVLEQMAAEDVRELASRIEGEGALSEADVQRKTEAELVDHLVDHQERTSSELAPRELSAEEKINFVPASLDVSAVAGEGGGHIIRAAGVQGNLAIEQHQSNFESKDEHDCNLSDVEEEDEQNQQRTKKIVGRSWAWQWATFVAGSKPERAICKLCNKKMSGATNALASHLTRMHHEEKQSEGSNPSAPKRSRSAKSSVTNFFTASNADLSNEATNTIIIDINASSMVEKPGFKGFCERFLPKLKPPSRRNVSRTLMAKHTLAKKVTAAELSEVEGGSIALTTDGWSSRAQDEFESTTAQHLTADFELRMLPLSITALRGPKTAERLAKNVRDELPPVRRSMNAKKTFTITRDNGSNVTKACELLKRDRDAKQHFSCAAHCLNLVVEAALADKIVSEASMGEMDVIDQKESQLESMFVDQDMASDPSMSVGGDDDGDFLSDQAINELASAGLSIEIAIKRVRQVCTHFRRSNKAAAEFMKSQQSDADANDASSEALKLLIDVPTRWNSTHDVLQRAHTLRSHVGKVLSTSKSKISRMSISPHTWELIAQLVKCLQPPKLMTDVLCSVKFVTFSVVAPSWMAATLKLKATSAGTGADGSDAQRFAPSSAKGLEHSWKTGIGKPEVLIAAHLDPRRHKLKFTPDKEARKAIHLKLIEQVKEVLKAEHVEAKQHEELLHRQKLLDGAEEENDCASSSKASELELALATCESDSESEDDSISNFNDEDAHAKATLEFETHEKTMARTGVYGATNLDIFDWWRKHHKSFPNLAVVARHHLSMPATSVESERIFSLCGLMLTAHRSALSTDTAEALALLNKLSKLDRFWKVLKHEKGTAGGSKVEKNGS